MRILSKLFPSAALLIFAGVLSADPIVMNGGFETGDFTGWTLSGDSTYTAIKDVNPHMGTYAAHIGADDLGGLGPGFISQDLITHPGVTYILTFSYGEYLSNGPIIDYPDIPQHNQFEVYWGSNLVYQAVDFPTGDPEINHSYITVVKNVMATGSLTTLKFSGIDRQADIMVDDVSAGTPEPGSMALVGSALAAALWFKVRRRRSSR